MPTANMNRSMSTGSAGRMGLTGVGLPLKGLSSTPRSPPSGAAPGRIPAGGMILRPPGGTDEAAGGNLGANRGGRSIGETDEAGSTCGGTDDLQYNGVD